ncbi:hypothetical protein GCK32_007038 [Trichostrongylus colubriformis]|uniref:Uncharacterized protein n=1 Tax=Trichostrongylus colubriformis TaxID=6319 RepID=A0AAN8G4F1_TRICO
MDDTQSTTTFTDTESSGVPFDDLESTLREVREMRAKLSELMEEFVSQQEEMEQLDKENAQIRRKIAESTMMQSSEKISPSVSNNNNRRTEGNSSIPETISHLLKIAKHPLNIDQSKKSMQILRKAQKEMEQIKTACIELDKFYGGSEEKLLKRREENDQLRKKLTHVDSRNMTEGIPEDANGALKPMLTLSHTSIMQSSPEKPNLTVDSMILLVEGKDPLKMQLDLESTLQRTKFCVTEGEQYRIRIDFFVHRENIKGLKYVHKVNRMNINLSKTVHKLGTYAPHKEMQTFTLEPQAAPVGIFYRGKYTIKSQLIDENEQNLLTWTWILKVVKK